MSMIDEELEEGRRRSTAMGLIITLLILAVILGGIFLLARWQSRGMTYTLQFEDAKGLQAGDPVFLSGVEIGQVRRIILEGEDDVRVVVKIAEEHAGKILEGSTAVITSPMVNVSGQMRIEIYNPGDGDDAAPLEDGALVEGQDNMLELKAWQLQRKLQTVGRGVSEQSRDMARNIGTMLEELKDIPESPEVKEALEKLESMTEELTERGQDAMERLGEEWDEVSDRFGPIIQDWKERGAQGARNIFESTSEKIDEMREAAQERIEERRQETQPVE